MVSYFCKSIPHTFNLKNARVQMKLNCFRVELFNQNVTEDLTTRILNKFYSESYILRNAVQFYMFREATYYFLPCLYIPERL
jgi:hypothetical protein